MTPAEEAAWARVGGNAPAATPAAVPPAGPAVAPSAMGDRSAIEQAAARRVQGQTAAPADDRSWWQRHVTGEGGYDPAIPELGAAQMPSGAGWQAYALPFMSSDPKARADILEKHVPGAKQSTDDHGNPVIELPGQGPEGKDTKKFYLNRPGVSEADVQGFVADVATSLPAARAFSGAKGLAGVLLRGLGQMGTQGVREVAAQKSGAETPVSQSLTNMGLAGAGSVGGDVASGAVNKIAQAVTPTIDDAAVSAAFGKAKLDWVNLPEAGRQQIRDRLGSFTPAQAKAVLDNPKNVQNLYRSSLQPEFGDLSRGQIAGDARQIGREVRTGVLPKGQTDEVGALLDRQSGYFRSRLLDLEGKSVADLSPASISSRLNTILKDPEALSLFEPGVLAELQRGKDFADMLRQKGTGGGDVTYKVLQQLSGRIPSLAVSLGMGALGLKMGGPYHALAAMAAGGGAMPSIKGAVNLYRAGQAAAPPPLVTGPLSLPSLSAGLLNSNLAVQSRGMGLLDQR